MLPQSAKIEFTVEFILIFIYSEKCKLCLPPRRPPPKMTTS